MSDRNFSPEVKPSISLKKIAPLFLIVPLLIANSPLEDNMKYWVSIGVLLVAVGILFIKRKEIKKSDFVLIVGCLIANLALGVYAYFIV